MKTTKRSTTQPDARSFIELRHDLKDNLCAILFLSGIELEKLLIKEQTSDNLRDILICAAEATAALQIMFAGFDGTESSIQPYPTEETRLPSNQEESAN